MDSLDEKIEVNKFMLFVKGICISMIMSIVMILVLSIVLSVTSINENIIMPTVIFISTFSILINSFFVSKRIKEKGIIYGSILGLLYMLILYLISSIMSFDFSLNTNAIIMIIVGILGGAIGGILGVNLK